MPGVFPKLFTSQDYGAPTLGATAGSLIALLDACLLTGYGSRPMGAITVTGTTAQATVGSGHGLMAGQVILVAGANESQFNGEFKITATGQSTVTYTVPAGTPASATGTTITFKMSPMGWTKVFTGTNKAVYRTAATINTVGLYLRVDDNPTALGFANKVAQVTAYELMTDVDTGFYAVPRPTQNVLNWPKSDGVATSGGLRNWVIYGDDRFFYLWVNPSQTISPSMNGVTVGFGDLDAPQTLDGYGAMLTGYTYDCTQSAALGGGDLAYSVVSAGTAYCPRPSNGIGTPQAISHVSPGTISGSVSGNLGGLGIAWPDPASGGFFLNNVLCADSKGGMRGWLPGMYHILQGLTIGNVSTAVIQHLAQIDGMRNLVGRKLAFMSAGTPQSASYVGSGYFFDLTGPFRNYN